MSRDIGHILERLSTELPGVQVTQLQVKHPGADDDGLWCITIPDQAERVQIESSYGCCPFLIESDFNIEQVYGHTVNEDVSVVKRLLGLKMEPPPVPHRFNARIDGFMDASCSVVLRDGSLTYNRFGYACENPKCISLTPTAEQWREFRQTLDALKIWQWQREYVNNHADDGRQWSLDIAYTDNAIKTRGDNSYPDANGEPKDDFIPTTAFKVYLAAVRQLIDGETFA